jgi:CheY-like chemotaxis protein
MKKIERIGQGSQRPPAGTRTDILYVEDDDQNWLVAELRLQRYYRLTRAINDLEACEAVRAKEPPFIAILMDIELPGSALNGIELTRLFRGRCSRADLPLYARDVPRFDMPIIFVSAYTGRYSETELLQAGGNRLIPKPVDFARLTSALTQLTLEQMTKLQRR